MLASYNATSLCPKGNAMKHLERITFDPNVMGGKPCVRGLRVTVGMVTGLVAAGYTQEDIFALYPYLEAEDIKQALSFAAWRAEEMELPLIAA
jgi:uncharacterized protein (DUF433 family)